MKIAVTGGSGFIGTRLVKRLADLGHKVLVLDIVVPELNGNEQNIEFEKADIMNLEKMISTLQNVDVVFHMAGMVLNAVRKNPYKAIMLHVNGTANVVESCRLNTVKNIIYASTFYVYDGIAENEIVNEETQLNIFYMESFGATKLMGEAIIKDFHTKYGLNYTILRLGSAYGSGKCTNVIKTFIESGLKREPIEVWGQGKRRNQYTYVDDIVEGCMLAMGKLNETYNIISPEETTTGELAELLKEKCGFEVVYNPIQKEGASMPYMSSRKAIKELGWRPATLEEGVEKTLNKIKRDLEEHKL